MDALCFCHRQTVNYEMLGKNFMLTYANLTPMFLGINIQGES